MRKETKDRHMDTLYGIDGNVLIEGLSVKDKHDLENILNDCFWIRAQCDLYRRATLMNLGRRHPQLWRELGKRRRCWLGITQARSASRKQWLRLVTQHLAEVGALERFLLDVKSEQPQGDSHGRANQIRVLHRQRRRDAMTKGYSKDLRERAVVMVEEEESRREVARVLNLAPSTAVRWLDRWNRTGSVAAKPGTGHSRSPLKAYEQWLLDLVAKEPDLTLEEIRDRLRRAKKLAVATSSVWRFYDRHEITFKKSPARG